MAKKKFNWKKFKKKAGKAYAKSQKWIEKNINPDLYTGHEDRIIGGESFGMQDMDFDFETAMFGSKPKKRRRR